MLPQDMLSQRLFGKMFNELTTEQRFVVKRDPLWLPLMYGKEVTMKDLVKDYEIREGK